MAFFGPALQWVNREIGFKTLFHADRDTHLILLCRFLRMFAYGAVALILAIFLWTNGVKGQQIGTFMTLTLLGDAAISFLLTLAADKIGRRRVLFVGSLLMAFSGTVFALTRMYWLLVLAAIIGVISPGAHEVGPFRAVEESILAQLSPIETRTDIYAWYAVLSTFGMACGLAASGWLAYAIRTIWDVKWSAAFPHIFWMYAAIGVIKAILTLCLTEACEADIQPEETMESESTTLLQGRRSSVAKTTVSALEMASKPLKTKLSKESKGILIKLCMLFAVNAFASGMLPVTLMSMYTNWRFRYFVHHRLGNIMAAMWFASSISNLFSASVARRIGLVKAMVFTHLPGAILLGFIPLAQSWFALAVLIILRAAFNSMDQAPRSAFVAAVFLPEERTAVMGTINLVKTLGQAAGPLITGVLIDRKKWWVGFVIGAVLKVIYDIGLLAMFLKTKVPEHGRRPRQTPVTEMDVVTLMGGELLPLGQEDDDDDADEGEPSEGSKVQYEWGEDV
ncbi:MFS general substrate transporter [Rhizodiscina lignyota]|uniref:MFS general substrate transporter n=1 Tax=Rhizodiscina lignyota TaxID=1504668 RepID=A0A9P4M4N4_9PEZI|nr:MFS general substrate transporter [Rhizodiscina lignyota]